MKLCSHCIDYKFDNEFKLTLRTGTIDEDETGRVAYQQSWCIECTARYHRIKRGSQTSLDIAVELGIELDKEWRKWLRE